MRSFKPSFIMCCMSVHLCLCAYECGWMRSPEEPIRPTGTEVLGHCGTNSCPAREGGALNPQAISQSLSPFLYICFPIFFWFDHILWYSENVLFIWSYRLYSVQRHIITFSFLCFPGHNLCFRYTHSPLEPCSFS